MGSLFPDAGLLFKVNEAERMIFKHRRDASDIAREGIELMDPEGNLIAIARPPTPPVWI